MHWCFYTKTFSLTLAHRALSRGQGRMRQSWPKGKGIELSGSEPGFQDDLAQVHIYQALLLLGIPRDIIKTWGCSRVTSFSSLLWHR